MRSTVTRTSFPAWMAPSPGRTTVFRGWTVLTSTKEELPRTALTWSRQSNAIFPHLRACLQLGWPYGDTPTVVVTNRSSIACLTEFRLCLRPVAGFALETKASGILEKSDRCLSDYCGSYWGTVIGRKSQSKIRQRKSGRANPGDISSRSVATSTDDALEFGDGQGAIIVSAWRGSHPGSRRYAGSTTLVKHSRELP